MTTSPPALAPVVAVGAALWNAEGEVLLIRRGTAPRQGEWSIPGGRIEWGETMRQALKREIQEETGLEAEILDLVDVVDAHFPDDGSAIEKHYVLVDFAARVTGGELKAGSDAMEARFVATDKLANYPMWDETRRIIAMSAMLLGALA